MDVYNLKTFSLDLVHEESRKNNLASSKLYHKSDEVTCHITSSQIQTPQQQINGRTS